MHRMLYFYRLAGSIYVGIIIAKYNIKQNGGALWWIRVNSSFQSEVAFSNGGMFGFDGDVEMTSRGVVPAFKFNPPSFKINISFDLNGGEWAVGYSAPTSYMSNEAIDFPSSGNVKKNGFTFNGWEQSLVENNTAFLQSKMDR